MEMSVNCVQEKEGVCGAGWRELDELCLCCEQELQRHFAALVLPAHGGCWQEESRAGLEILLPNKLLMKSKADFSSSMRLSYSSAK